jgi:hypothetical protein
MQQPNRGDFIPLGFYPAGDFGPFTWYTSKNRRVVRFLRAPPTSPPSWLQQRQRSAWIAAAATWSTNSSAFRTWWHAVAALNGLKIGGYNLYMHLTTANDPSGLQALKQPGPMP